MSSLNADLKALLPPTCVVTVLPWDCEPARVTEVRKTPLTVSTDLLVPHECRVLRHYLVKHLFNEKSLQALADRLEAIAGTCTFTLFHWDVFWKPSTGYLMYASIWANGRDSLLNKADLAQPG